MNPFNIHLLFRIFGVIGIITSFVLINKLIEIANYSQAWSLVWDDAPLFGERIEAWANGPVIPALYEKHKGNFFISKIKGNPENLNKDQRETVDAIIKEYGDKTSDWLSQLTHREAPWKLARSRAHLKLGERGNAEIKLGDMAEYYGGLSASQSE